MDEQIILPKRYIFLIMGIGAILQLVCQYLSLRTGILVLYNFGIMLITCIFGLVPGIITAFVSGIALVLYSGISFYFMMTAFVCVIITYFLCTRHFFQTGVTIIRSSVILGSIQGMINLVLSIYLVDDRHRIFFFMKDISARSVMIGIGANIVDVLICIILIRMIMIKIPQRVRLRFPFQHWVTENEPFWRFSIYKNTQAIHVRKLPLHSKVLLICSTIILIAGISLILISAKVYTEHAFETYGDIAKHYAQVADGIIMKYDPDDLISIHGGESTQYKELSRDLKRYVDESQGFITYLYIYQIIVLDNHEPGIRVIYDSDPEGNSFGEKLDMTEEYYDPIVDSLTDTASQDVVGPSVSYGHWGWLMSVYKPIIDSRGEKVAYVGVDLSMNEVIRDINIVDLKVICLSSMVFMALLTGIYTYIKYLVVKPVVRLDEITRDFTATRQRNIDRSRPIRSGDELENLYNSILETEEIIVEDKIMMEGYLDTIKQLAYRDELTGVKNMTAYEAEVKRLEYQIANKTAKFGIVMVDMNELKQVNDIFGHEKGSIAIQKMCQLICQIFTHSPVFRIGGDEFAVILENTDFANRIQLVKELSKYAVLRNMSSDAPWDEVALSYGEAEYTPGQDQDYKDVFNRADMGMYERKKALKKQSR